MSIQYTAAVLASDQAAAGDPRKRRARETRRRMVEAAQGLFAERGYSVPMTEIAERAGVAVQTLYFTFHTKEALLGEALSLAVLGDEQPLAPHQRPWFAQLQAEPDARRAVRILVDSTQRIFERVAPLVGVFQSGEPEPAALWTHSEQLRLEGYRDALLPALAKKGRFRAGLDRAAAADVLFVLLSPALYDQVVVRRGWSAQRWRDWITDLLTDAIFERP